jgi:MoaA/NifB/PqqE/SkfB family radical SAM enzyme
MNTSVKVFIQKWEDENKELKANTTLMKSQVEELKELRKMAKAEEVTKIKWVEIIFHHKQHKALGSQVEALIKEKKEKENVLTYWN